MLCEGANVRPDGRIDCAGIFHQLYAPGFPAQQDVLTLAIDIEWDASEAGRLQFSIDLLDPDRSPALTINGHTDVSATPDGQPHPLTRLVMPLNDVVFPKPGTYEFVLSVGEEQRALVPLHLVEDPDAR